MFDDEPDDDDGGGGDGRKSGGLAAGLLAALGLGGLRFADNCASVGARAVRSADDVAIGGARLGGGLDDATRLGGRTAAGGLDDAALPGSRLAGGLDGGPPRLSIRPAAAAGEEGHWLESLGEFAVDAGFEVVSYEPESRVDADAGLPDDMPPPMRRVDGALAVDLDIDAWVFQRLGDDDKPTTAGPWIFTGRAEKDGMYIAGELIETRALAAACQRRQTTCVFVACASNCSGETESLFFRSKPNDGVPLEPYVAQFVAARLVATPKPMWVAVADERLTIMRSKG